MPGCPGGKVIAMELKGEQWFEWERQGTVHPIIICMESWMEPTKKAFGKPWPSCVLVFKGDIICWHLKWPELLDYGDYLIMKFISKEARDLLLKDINEGAASLGALFRRMDSSSIEAISDAELQELYQLVHDGFVRWFVPGALVEPIGHKGERLIKKLVSNLPEEEQAGALSLLTTTTRESFSIREMKDLLKIAAKKNAGADVAPLIDEQARKYFWLHNNYFSTEVLDSRFFMKELSLTSEKYPDPEAQLANLASEFSDVTRRKKELIENLDPDEFNRNLIELLDIFAWYQDYRKEIVMKVLHYLDIVLSEIGRRRGHSLKEMKYTLPEEIPKVLDGTFDISLARERMKRYIFYFDGDSTSEHGVGEWSLRKEKEIFSFSSTEGEILEIPGMVANKGTVRGRARVTMSAKEAKNIEKGEILITSMTSPDFVTAMKKAAAIVTNEGGVLCHAAVVSREFDIPCIVGTKLATRVFKTGDMIEVDGELGVVRKVHD
jgi:phosphoenolpyruvate synthase/pyruvate phosphate dikinase